MSEILKVENVSKNFAGLKALSNINITVDSDEIFGIIGPNGAGKTTLFNVISGFTEPSAGKIFFRGKDMTGKGITDYAVHGLSRTFQNIRVFSEMTVLQNITVGMHNRIHTDLLAICLNTKKQKEAERKAYERAMEILKFLEIDKFANEYAGSLPYGTQRLVEIGRALASDPVLLLLDEPTAGMNEQETMELMELIKRIHKDGPTVIVIEHNMKFMMNLCHRITVLNFGEMLMTGIPSEVQSNPQVIEGKRQILMRSDTKLSQPFASWSNSL